MVVVFLQYFIFIELHFVWWLSFYMYFIFIELHFVWWLSFYSILYSLSFILYGGCLFTVHVFYIHWASFCMVVVFLQYFIFIELHFVWWLSFYSISYSLSFILYGGCLFTCILYSLSFILYGGCLFTVFYIH